MAKSKAAKNADLPGMEDRAIKELHTAAIEYDEAKKARMAKTLVEVEAKNKVREVMAKHNRKHYAFDGIEITIDPPDGVEKVTVKVKQIEPEDQAAKDAEDGSE